MSESNVLIRKAKSDIDDALHAVRLAAVVSANVFALKRQEEAANAKLEYARRPPNYHDADEPVIPSWEEAFLQGLNAMGMEILESPIGPMGPVGPMGMTGRSAGDGYA